MKAKNNKLVWGIMTLGILLGITIPFATANEVAYFPLNGTTGSQETMETISQTSFDIANHFDRPERIAGINEQALRLDGFSTWAYHSDFQLPDVSDKLTVSAWYATESFNKEQAGIVSQWQNNGGFALEVGPYGNVSFVFFADNTQYTVLTDQSLDKYQWNYIVADVDLSASVARIHVNGQLWASLTLPSHDNLILSNTTMYLGRHNKTVHVHGFLMTALNGALDEISILNHILSESEIAENYEPYQHLVPDLTIDPFDRYAEDFHRPHYHPMPNASWANESYGLTWYNDQYHMFFQKNPNHPTLHFMHWGHLTSPDLVKWTEEKIALAPSPGFDNFGVWSGTTIIDDDGTPQILYTGVDGQKAGMGLASPDDENLISWTKYEGNPVVASPPSNYNHMDFRDPYVWKSDGYYYMTIGSGLQNNGGGILFTYRSEDLINWTEITPLASNPYVDQTGIFWEMPFFYPLNDDDVYLLGIVPVPTPHKPAETLYWIGKWENETFTPFFDIPKKWELINGPLLSPAINADSEGRIVYSAIIPEDRSEELQIASNWRHTFSIPRVVRLLSDSSIGQIPHPNLCRLRDEHTHIENRVVQPGSNNNLPEFSGKQAELKFKIKADEASRFTIRVFRHEDNQEYTSLIFDLANHRISFSREFSSMTPGTPGDFRSGDYIFDYRDTIHVNIFMDHSTVEVFVDNLTVFSFRVYPSREESQGLDFIVTQGQAEIVSLDAWTLKDMRDVDSEKVCEPEFLPSRFRTLDDLVGINETGKDMQNPIKLFPNPAQEELNLSFQYPVFGKASINILDMAGIVRMVQDLDGDNKAHNTLSNWKLDISDLAMGNYMLVVFGEHVFASSKFTVLR
ncbi:MAG: GH32 C-terminal domain-containing protein [Bacteroidota bacterium]